MTFADLLASIPVNLHSKACLEGRSICSSPKYAGSSGKFSVTESDYEFVDFNPQFTVRIWATVCKPLYNRAIS